MAIDLKHAWGHKMNFLLLLKPLNKMERHILLLSVAFMSLQDFLNEWMWSPPWTLSILIVVLHADLFSGIALSLKNGEGFSTKKFASWLFTVVAFLFLLGVTYNMPKINDALGWPAISPILAVISKCFYLLILLNTILSAFKNLVLVGALKGQIALLAIKYIDTYKNKAGEALIKTINSVKEEK